MDRPYMDATIEDLERMVSQYKADRVILAQIRDELGFRHRDRAKQLLKEVRALLAGQVRMPKKPPKPDDPENQLDVVE